MNTSPATSTPSFATLIFSCSGGSDVGGIADRAARRLGAEGVGKMFCIAGVGGAVESILNTTRKAERILVIDGCAKQCARKSLERAGITTARSLELGSLGLVKGKSPESEATIQSVVTQGKQALGAA